MDMVKCILSALFVAYAFALLVHAQDQSGFISIDCGLSEASSYIDATTGISYTSDASFVNTGISRNISPELQANVLEQQFLNVRSFPNGIKNCYTLRPTRVNGYKYLIRARFMYGNYDAQNQPPEFDLHVGVHRWDSVKLEDASTVVTKEILHAPSSNYTYVCLVNTGSGTPFLSVLELRLLKNTTYATPYGSLALLMRLDMGKNTTDRIRFKDDIYDRIWTPSNYNGAQISTLLPIDAQIHNDFQPPSTVMQTAATPLNANDSLDFFWVPEDPTSRFHIYLHFAEVEKLEANQFREFNISLNGTIWFGPLVPDYLLTTTTMSIEPESVANFSFSIYKTQNSTLPPILNAFEVYMVKQMLQSQTDQADVDAAVNIKSTYGVKRNWQGDPCAPQAYSWDGLNCSYNGYAPPRVISLNLSSSGLTGEISPMISSFRSIQYLDLSNNYLTGPVPQFLSELPSLKFVNLTRNKLTGSVPAELIERSKKGLLSLSVGENPNLCSSVSCKNTKKKNIVVPVVVSVVLLIFLLIASAILWSLKRRKLQVGKFAKLTDERTGGPNKKDVMLKAKNQFTYSEILSITNNLERVIGEGGFGTVYHGYVNETEVAVKMLSPSSAQGYQQFQAEVKLLIRVHHRNLTSLVGYCDEGDNMGLIYEYMANGNLQEHLSDKNPNCLSWEWRLSIALDAAQGLEYLHNGCKPPIIQRDVKSTNILLNKNFQAKVADFGLSRDFPIEAGTHISTGVVGTPGYLDPEYFTSNRLNEKSDVFSFGVVLLEIITGQPVIRRNQENAHIGKWVSFMLDTEGDVGNIIDPRLGKNYDISSLWKAVEVAMACVSHTSMKRPFMDHVVVELKQCLEAEIARKKEESVEMVSLILNTELSPMPR